MDNERQHGGLIDKWFILKIGVIIFVIAILSYLLGLRLGCHGGTWC